MLNKIPVLDKGYVALFSTSVDRKQLLSIKAEYLIDNEKAMGLPTVHMEIKCPLFVQLFLTEELNAFSKRSAPEAFIPTVADIAARDLKTSELIANDIDQTVKALLINPKSYQMDGCDIFISQVISPVSVYNTLLVSGTLNQWVSIVKRSGLPAPIEQYRKAIADILLCEYDFIKEQIGGKENKKRSRSRKHSNKED